MFTLNWQPRLQTWKRYAAAKTAIIERVCYLATLCLCRTVCPLNSVSKCFAISRSSCMWKYKYYWQWSNGSCCSICFCGHSELVHLFESKQAWHLPLLFGVKCHVDIKSLLTILTSDRKWRNKNTDICCMTQQGHAAWLRTEHRTLFLVERKPLFCVSVSEARKKDILECSNIVTHYPRKSSRKIP